MTPSPTPPGVKNIKNQEHSEKNLGTPEGTISNPLQPFFKCLKGKENVKIAKRRVQIFQFSPRGFPNLFRILFLSSLSLPVLHPPVYILDLVEVFREPPGTSWRRRSPPRRLTRPSLALNHHLLPCAPFHRRI